MELFGCGAIDGGQLLESLWRVIQEIFSPFWFSRSEQYLAPGSEDKSIIIWNKERQEKEHPPLKGHLGPIAPIKFSFGDQKDISGSLDGTIRLWKMNTGEVL